ncbi:MAG: tetratricopeptide repeat protein [Xanthobacteraceae bacterium]|nr:MAG: tetratricopeptide repeat protein [Xanthobacteraceae bacterium]
MLLAAPVDLAAQPHGTLAARRPAARTVPAGEREVVSISGNYLAARHASVQRDATAASTYYRAALRADPLNNDLLDRAFISALADGDIAEAVKLADRIVAIDKSNRVARLVIGVRALKQKQYAAARANIAQSVRGPITDLVATLLNGWASAGAGDARGALAAIDKLAGPEWYPIFKDLHAGMIAEMAGNPKEAGIRLERSYKLDPTTLRVADAYARWLSRHKSPAAAAEVYETFDKGLAHHPLILEGLKETRAGKKRAPLIDSPQAGAAEALYGVGASLSRRGGEDLALIYLQLALYLTPNHSMALLSLADLYEAVKKPQLAIAVYARVPADSPVKRNAQIQLASNLDSLERTDEATAILKGLIAENPNDLEAIMALGNIQRDRKKFADCADTYARAIAQLPETDKKNWVFYYFRGICAERSKQWALAEADLKRALQMQPEQPMVLNYLGYSWIDQGINLDEGMKMIRRAVDQRPDDGYIVDSLGWAYYRTGNFDEATKHLERAIELKPEDPTINDHLGDAYWRIGRTLEAKFQWAHARDLKPDPGEVPKIEAKLRDGLPDDKASSAAADKDKKDGKNGG